MSLLTVQPDLFQASSLSNSFNHNLELKNKIMKCLVWSVVLYAAETWMLMQTDKRLEAFEMCIRRRMLKISWLDKVTNEEVLRRVNKDKQILNYIWQRKHHCMF